MTHEDFPDSPVWEEKNQGISLPAHRADNFVPLSCNG
jgi:hypothetical protein